jgi:hypothetical protein
LELFLSKPSDVQLRIVDGRHVYTVVTGNGETNKFSVPSKFVKSDGNFDYAGIASSFTAQRNTWNTVYKIFDGPKSYYESFKKDLGIDFGKYSQADFSTDHSYARYGGDITHGEYEPRRRQVMGDAWTSWSPDINKFDADKAKNLINNTIAANGWSRGLEYFPKTENQTGAQLWAVEQKRIDDANAKRDAAENARKEQRAEATRRFEQQQERRNTLQLSNQPPVKPVTDNHYALTDIMTRAQQGKLWQPTKTDLKLVDAFGPATTAAVLMARHPDAADLLPPRNKKLEDEERNKKPDDSAKVTLSKLRDRNFVDKIFSDRGVDLSRQDAATVAARLSPDNVTKKLGPVGGRPDATADEIYKAAEAAPDAPAPAVRAPKTKADPAPRPPGR